SIDGSSVPAHDSARQLSATLSPPSRSISTALVDPHILPSGSLNQFSTVRYGFGGFACPNAIASGIAIAFGQANPPNPYRTVENWFKLPDGRMWGSTSAVEIDRDGGLRVADSCRAESCAGTELPSML